MEKEGNTINELADVYKETEIKSSLNVISSETKKEDINVNSAYDKITGNYWYNNKSLWLMLRTICFIIILLVFLGLIFNFEYNSVKTSTIFWFFLIPLMVVIIYFVPMLWRNICPLATTHLFNFNFFHKKRLSKEGVKANIPSGVRSTAYKFLIKNGVLISALLFWIIVPMRLFLFNKNDFLTLILLLIIFLTALIMGFLFPVKSGWCTSICPVFSAEKTYGINPMLYIMNQRCDYYNEQLKKVNSCSGCSFNCIDVNEPEACYFMESCSRPFHDNINALMRKIFISTFPGFVLGYMFFTDGFNLFVKSLNFEILIALKDTFSTNLLLKYSAISIFMGITFLIYNLIKYLFRRFIKEQLTLDKPNRTYSLYKRRLDLSFILISFNLFWIGSSYAMIFYVFSPIFKLSNDLSLNLFSVLFFTIFTLSIVGLIKGWNETFIQGEHNPSWW